MVWKKTFFVLSCCLVLTLLSTGIKSISAADRDDDAGSSDRSDTETAPSKTPALTSIGAMIAGPIHPDIAQWFINGPVMMNAGLPYDQIRDNAVWGQYLCFVNNGLACVDSTDPKNPTKIISPFNLLNGDLVNEGITDISASGDTLYVATDKNIYKFVLAEDGKITKSVEVEKGALQITAFNGGIVYFTYTKDGAVLSGTNVPTEIPMPNYIIIKNLLSTKSYLLIVGDGIGTPPQQRL